MRAIQKRRNEIVVFVLMNFSITICFSQELKERELFDSFNINNFEYLSEFNKIIKKNPKNAEVYAKDILSKAKNNKDHIRMVYGYSLLFKINHNPSYLDSMIVVSEKTESSNYISFGNSLKGNYLYSQGEYSKALESYLVARKYTKDDSYTYHILIFNIGLLKLELGNYEEAQNLFLDFKKYIEGSDKTASIDYVSCLYAIAYTYSKMNQISFSDSFVKLGLEINEKIGSKENYSNLLLVSGINSYYKKDYAKSLETLKVVSKLIKKNSSNNQNLALSEYYMGMCYYDNNNNAFLEKFKGVDSITINSKNVTSELREAYPKLIDYYKKIGDKEKQLFYIEHLLIIDSILHRNNYALTSNINNKYDTPLLLNEKQKLISELDSKNYFLILLTAFIFTILAVLVFLYSKSRKKIKYYQNQASILTKPREVRQLLREESKTKKKNYQQESKITFSNEILLILDIKFGEFEKNRNFLNKNMSLEILSKEFETNRDYLSKYVNELKGKSFSQYINELRIKYIVEELKTNSNLQKFTIAGIAEEAGYNNSESFTNSFKKITKTLPSYYIKALKEL